MGLWEGEELVLVLGCERSPNPPRSKTGPRRDERDSLVVDELPVVCGDSSAAIMGDLAERRGSGAVSLSGLVSAPGRLRADAGGQRSFLGCLTS